MKNSNKNFLGSFSVNTWLIIANVFLFIVFTLLISFNILSWDFVAIKANNIFAGKYIWTFLTSMFMHAGFFHLFVNMFSLFFVGKFLEKLIGKKRYVWFYIFSGIFAGIFFVLLSGFFGNSDAGARIFGSPEIYAVGASGAIFGILGVLAVLVPYSKIYLIAGPILVILADTILKPIIPSGYANAFDIIMNVLIIVMIFSIFSFNNFVRKLAVPVKIEMWLLPFAAIVPLFVVGFFVNLPIGNTAHLGGLIAGLAYGFYLRNKYKKKASYIRRVFS